MCNRISSRDIISADPVSLAEEIADLKKEVLQLKQELTIQKNNLPPEDNISVEALRESELSTKPISQDISDFDGFYSKNNLDIPAFSNETLKPLDIPSEENGKDVKVQKEVMPTHRTDKDTPLTDNSMKQKNLHLTDISSSELFKILF